MQGKEVKIAFSVVIAKDRLLIEGFIDILWYLWRKRHKEEGKTGTDTYASCRNSSWVEEEMVEAS